MTPPGCRAPAVPSRDPLPLIQVDIPARNHARVSDRSSSMAPGEVSSQTVASSVPPPRKRTKAQSCDSCRRRKLKCDRGWPCGACCDRNEQHLCTWGDGVIPERSGRDAMDSTGMMQRMNMLDEKLERILSRLDASSSPASSCAPATCPPGSCAPATKTLPTLGWDLHCYDMLSCMSPDAYLQHRRDALEHMFNGLPDPDICVFLMDVFTKEIEWMSGIITERRVESLISNMSLLREQVKRQPSYLQTLNLEQVTHRIYVLAICYGIFSIALLPARDSSQSHMMEGRVPSSHMRYLQDLLVGLRTMDTLAEPTIEFVIAMTLLIVSLCCSRPPASAAFLLGHVIQVALLLGLDEEPPASMPFEEASCRVHLYAILCIHDWFMTTFIKRRSLILEDAKKLPSVFGTEEQRSKFLLPYHRMKLRIANLFCRSSSLMIPTDNGYTHVQQLHQEAKTLQGETQRLWNDIHDGTDLSYSMKHLQRTCGDTALHYLMIRIHLPYYMLGWDDQRYRLSRDTCFSSARALLRLFRDAFSWKVPMKNTGASDESYFPTEFPIASRMWYFCHWCTAAAVLLLKHLTLLNERNEQPSWDVERESIVQDLCIMSRLLNYLAPVSSIAQEGYDSMQRVAAHIMQVDLDTLQPGSGNCVTHWADRVMPTRCSQKPHAEPMSMLKSLVRHNDLSVSDTGSDSMHESPESSTTGDSQPASASSAAMDSGTTPQVPDMSSTVPSMLTTEFDTFWAKFAVPPLSTPLPPAMTANSMPMPNELPALSPFLLPSQNLMQTPTDISSVVHPKDMLMGDPLNFNVGTIGPFTDHFIRSLDDYAKSGPPPTALPLR